jgi:hypothetical protein
VALGSLQKSTQRFGTAGPFYRLPNDFNKNRQSLLPRRIFGNVLAYSRQLWTARIGLASHLPVAGDLPRLRLFERGQTFFDEASVLRLDFGLDDADNLVRLFGADLCARNGR